MADARGGEKEREEGKIFLREWKGEKQSGKWQTRKRNKRKNRRKIVEKEKKREIKGEKTEE